MCWVCKIKGIMSPAFAIWFYDRTSFRESLCKGCLDQWLDNADSEPDLEPSNVVFL